MPDERGSKLFLVSEDTNEWMDDLPDHSEGVPIDHVFEYVYRYIVDIPAITASKVLKAYPNGGKEVESYEVEPEQGHWIIEDLEGNVLNWPIDEALLDYFNKREPNKISARGYLFHWYSDEEKQQYFADMKVMETETRVFELQQDLNSSDYITAKFIDRLLLLDNLEDLPVLIEEFRADYSDELEIRQSQRDKINQLRE